MKRCFACLWASWIVALVLSAAAAAGDNVPVSGEVKFRWAFGVIRGGAGDDEVTLVTRDTEMSSGDRLKFYLEPAPPCFVYLFYLSPQGELERLFPPEADGPPEAGAGGVYIPGGDLWFVLDDHPGPETFFLLASDRRLTSIEQAYAQFLETADPQRRLELKAGLVDEIRRVRKARRQLSAAAERPLPVGGNLRGTVPGEASDRTDLADMAVEISGGDFYSRAYTIDHR